jgi:three-Cys-motif partner protein
LQNLRDVESFREDIQLVNEDANPFLGRICSQPGWDERRAVLFLDPFGMQVVWDTIKAIANTKAIDLWLLFPLGIAVNRLLRRDGKISETHKLRLNDIFRCRSTTRAILRFTSSALPPPTRKGRRPPSR